MSTQPVKPLPSERRADPRCNTRLIAIVQNTELGELTFTARGFSRSGAFLERRDADTPLPPIGAMIHVVFHWPLSTQLRPVQVDAKVVRLTDHGIGVQFELAPATAK